MHQRIIAALTYPRSLMRGNLALEDCAHNGDYCGEDLHCAACDYVYECSWLCNADEYAALENRSLATLVAALDFALDYVRAQIALADHDPQSCRCASCGWLRRAENLLAEAFDRIQPS